MDAEEDRLSKVDPIPLDLVLAILIRLPAKSLMKFQCVSKMWSSIVRSQRFVDSYYDMSLAKQPSRFVIAVSPGPSSPTKLLFIFSSSYEKEEGSSLATNLDMTIPSSSLAPGSNCTSVHGLIGVTNSGPFIVCNPSTRKVNTLPMGGLGARTYLGYDPVNSQFKALTRISSPYRYEECVVHGVVTLGGGGRRGNTVSSPSYYTASKAICINGFVYRGGWTPTRSENPVIVCFDVRYAKLSFIKAPVAVVCWECESILIEYKGKLASIVRCPYAPFHSFDLWILEDVENHDWSKQTFELPFALGEGTRGMTSPGTTKAGEIIFAPKYLPNCVQPFYIFFYNVETKDMRRVRLLGIGDDEEFRHRYGLGEQCCVFISPQHVETIASPLL